MNTESNPLPHFFFDKNEKLKTVEYRDTQGRQHRIGGPATTHFTVREGKEEQTRFWYFHGEAHREDGPAEIWNCGLEVFFIYCHEMTESEYNEEIVKGDVYLRLKYLGVMPTSGTYKGQLSKNYDF